MTQKRMEGTHFAGYMMEAYNPHCWQSLKALTINFADTNTRMNVVLKKSKTTILCVFTVAAQRGA